MYRLKISRWEGQKQTVVYYYAIIILQNTTYSKILQVAVNFIFLSESNTWPEEQDLKNKETTCSDRDIQLNF